MTKKTQLHFEAILAKNDIARELKDYKNGDTISVSFIVAKLHDLERYLGTDNQPSVDDILESEMRI